MLLPALQRAREAGRRTHCINNLRQIGIGIQLYKDDFNERPPSSWSIPATGPRGSQGEYLLPGKAVCRKYPDLRCLDDRTNGHIRFDLGWEYFDNTSYAYHMGPVQQTTPNGKLWLKDQIRRWDARFIVAACPWHRHLFAGLRGRGDGPQSMTSNPKIKDVALRFDGSVDAFHLARTQLGRGTARRRVTRNPRAR